MLGADCHVCKFCPHSCASLSSTVLFPLSGVELLPPRLLGAVSEKHPLRKVRGPPALLSCCWDVRVDIRCQSSDLLTSVLNSVGTGRLASSALEAAARVPSMTSHVGARSAAHAEAFSVMIVLQTLRPGELYLYLQILCPFAD